MTNSASDKPQLEKFKEAAREAECDTDEKAFEEALKKVAKSKTKEASDESEHSENES
jgi:hypothetical protein